jgi:hypothetical protein
VGRVYVKKLVWGVGINDANYQTRVTVDGIEIWCPYFQVWKSMFQRCYSETFHKNNPTYIGCSVDERWHSFMSFRAWMSEQDWEGKALDKDLLVYRNKVYGPDTCIFVTKEVNNFLNENARRRGKYPIGVSWVKSSGKNYAANIGITGKGIKYLGVYETPDEAHLVYVSFKEKLASELISVQTDPRVVNALRLRYCKN